MGRLNQFLTIVFVGLSLSACGGFSEDDPPLPGDRVSVLALQKSLEPGDYGLEDQGLVVPNAWRNDFWPQGGGYPNHSMQNLILSENALEPVWSADIGSGVEDGLPLTAQPILVNERVFTLDTEAQLSAFNAFNGDMIWRVDVSDEKEDDRVIAGGLAYSDGLVFVTNGYKEVLAVRPDDGEIIWRVGIIAPSRAAPTVIDGRVFVTTMDARLLALSVDDGRVLWEYRGISEGSGLLGAASAAANNDIVVPVFSSGEVSALRVENGSVAWSDNLSNIRGFGGLAEIADITALPVVDKGLVFAISFSGKLVAIDERTGQRVWQREISGTQTPWVAGNHVFVLSAQNQLVALGRETGVVRWITELPRFDDKDPIILHGPVLAGGRLIIFASDGRVIEVQPESGDVIRNWEVDDTPSGAPIVAGGMLYMLFDNGTLTAYR